MFIPNFIKFVLVFGRNCEKYQKHGLHFETGEK
jgi:hypothetical protein